MSSSSESPTPLSPSSQELFNDPAADVILRSSDNIDFRTFKAILSLASPDVFKRAFSAAPPQPSDGADLVAVSAVHPESGLPVVCMAEDSKTLDLLLQLLYPIEDPQLSCLDDVGMVLMAARKYRMKISGNLERILAIFTEEHALRVYAIACRCGVEAVARQAADVIRLSGPEWEEETAMAVGAVQWVPEMQHISADALFRLLWFCNGMDKSQNVPFIPERSHAPIEAPNPSPLTAHPFDQHYEESDLILKSSDGVSFHIVSVVLRIASQFFTKLFRELLGQATDAQRTHTISLPEDSQMLSWIIQFCYPMKDPVVDPCRPYPDLLAAARKYGIARFQEFVKRRCLEMAEEHALRAYLIAQREGWAEEATDVAKHAVYQRHDVYLPEMEDVPARAYYELLVYRCKCLNAICDSGKWQLNPHLAILGLEGLHWSKAAAQYSMTITTRPPITLNDMHIQYAMMNTMVKGGMVRGCTTAPGVWPALGSVSAVNRWFTTGVMRNTAYVKRLDASLDRVKLSTTTCS